MTVQDAVRQATEEARDTLYVEGRYIQLRAMQLLRGAQDERNLERRVNAEIDRVAADIEFGAQHGIT